MTNSSFWTSLQKPIIGLSPMDGITDPAFRFVIDRIGHPSVLFTEFVSSEGLSRSVVRLLRTFQHHKTSTPLVGQLFGANLEAMYRASILLCAIGIDGIDINMGCPNTHITKSGGGAALINDPTLAKKLIKQVQQASLDWENGMKLEDADFSKKFLAYIQLHFPPSDNRKRALVPVSVKTRIGLDKPATLPWIQALLGAEPSAINLHGRTLSQMYEGKADWEEIGKAAALAKKTKTLLLGNGDIISKKDAMEKSKIYSPDGVLIGRGSWGNPWVFTDKMPELKERIDAALLHVNAFEELIPDENVLSLRKHIAWYLKGFPNASDIRAGVMQLKTLDEIRLFLKKLN